MVTILCDYNIDELLKEPSYNIPTGNTKLFSYTQTKTMLTGDEVLYDTFVTLCAPEGSEPYLMISDDTTYSEYHPSDYNMSLSELHDILTHNLLTEGFWGV